MRKLLLPLALVLLSISCSTESSDNNTTSKMYDKKYIETASISEKLQYKKFHLLKLANWISKNLEDSNFRKEVNFLNQKEKNNPKIFIKDLYNYVNQNSTNKSIEDIALQKSLDAFTNLEGENWFPTITIINEQKSNSSNKVLDETKPIFMFAEAESDFEKEEFVGYQKDSENDDLVELDEMIDEPTSENKILYVFDTMEIDGAGGGASSTGNVNYGLSRIEKMTIKDHKEDWLGGASEVNIKAYRVFFGDNFNGPGGSGDCGIELDCSVACNDFLGKEISSYRRKEVRNEDEKTLNFKFHNTPLASNPPSINTVVYYVIFERDNWPAPKKSHTFPFADGSQRTVEYRSWQSKYHAESVLATGYNNNYEYLNGYAQDNDEIKYNLRNN